MLSETRKKEPVQLFALCILLSAEHTHSTNRSPKHTVTIPAPEHASAQDYQISIWRLFPVTGFVHVQSKLGHFDCVLKSAHGFLGPLLVETNKQTKK